MSCTSEQSRMDDKKEATEKAEAEFHEATDLVLAALAGMDLACGASLFVPAVAPGCLAAMILLVERRANANKKLELMKAASRAYRLAMKRYTDCLEKCQKPPSSSSDSD